MANAQLMGATMHQADERRRQERYPVLQGASAETHGDEPIAIIDISESGFKAICTRLPDCGDIITLMIGESGPLDARIVWTDDKIIGCEFLKPISRSQLAAIIESSPNAI